MNDSYIYIYIYTNSFQLFPSGKADDGSDFRTSEKGFSDINDAVIVSSLKLKLMQTNYSIIFIVLAA